MARIAVEEGLKVIGDYLKHNGYEVVPLNPQIRGGDVDCCVISGVDKDVLGMENITVNAPVINAEGMSAEEVYREVRERVRPEQ